MCQFTSLLTEHFDHFSSLETKRFKILLLEKPFAKAFVLKLNRIFWSIYLVQNFNDIWCLYLVSMNDHAFVKGLKFILFFFPIPRWDPAARLTPDEAFQHEWIQEVRTL